MPPRGKSDYRFECKAKTAEIFIYDEIDRWWGIGANRVAADLKAAGEVDVIRARINSEGGAVLEGVAMYNLLKLHPARVEVYVDGMAFSIASLVAMAGDTIEIAENAWMMIHDPSGNPGYASADECRTLASLLDSLRDTIAETYVARTGQTIEQINALMAAETWMDAGKALEMGFATTIGKSLKLAAHVDVERFENVPKILLPNKEKTTMVDSVATPESKEPVAQPPVAASFEDLKACLPGADNDFICAQLANKATLDQAQSAWMEEQNKRIAASDKKASEAMEAKAAAEAKPGLEVPPEGTIGKGGNDTGDPVADWNQRLQAKIKSGMSRDVATSRLAKEDPELRAAFVAAYNLSKGRQPR